MALNLYQHGIDPKLDFSDLGAIIDVYERCTGMTVPARQPYAGELVFTAFSGSHQDAIRKGLNEWKSDRASIGTCRISRLTRRTSGANTARSSASIRQSGKGGVAYLLESQFGIELPKDMQREFGPIANDEVDKLGREVTAAELKAMFWREYIERVKPWQLKRFETGSKNGIVKCRAKLLRNGKPVELAGEGNGPLAALVHGFSKAGVPRFEIAGYSEHALGSGEEASAIAYIQIKLANGKTRWGAGVDTNIELASIRAVLSALNRS